MSSGGAVHRREIPAPTDRRLRNAIIPPLGGMKDLPDRN